MLRLVPVSLREANAFVENFHRHHGRTQRDGGKFAVGASDGERLVGVLIVGRPVARGYDDGFTAEVTRCCVLEDAPRNACSFLYGRAWRAWQAMGGTRMVTYTLAHESGASLRGAGWKVLGERPGRQNEAWQNRPGRKWSPVYGQLKLCWEVTA